jgi:hypothetical protein
MSDYQAEFRNLAARFREVKQPPAANNLLAQAGRILLLAIEDGQFPELAEWSNSQKANLPSTFEPALRERYLRTVWESLLFFLSLFDNTAPTNPLGYNWKQLEDVPTGPVGTDPDLLSTVRNSAEICQRLSDRLSDPWKAYPTTQAAKLFGVSSRTIGNWVESKPELVRRIKPKKEVLLNSEHPDYKSAINRKES